MLARERALQEFAAIHHEEFVKLHNKHREKLGLPPVRGVRKRGRKTGCGFIGHQRWCLCDVQIKDN